MNSNRDVDVGLSYSMVLLAAGSGSRMGQAVPKQFHLLAGRPILMHSLERFECIEEIAEVVLVIQPEYRSLVESCIQNFRLEKKIKIVYGGQSRQSSVYLGLRACSHQNVLVHEAARPFVRIEDFRLIIADPEVNVTFGVGVPYTVLMCDNGYLSGSLDRSRLVNIQLPQKFDKSTLLKAHELAAKDGFEFTEDAGLVYHYQLAAIKVISGTDFNVKITTPIDFVLAEGIYKSTFGVEQ